MVHKNDNETKCLPHSDYSYRFSFLLLPETHGLCDRDINAYMQKRAHRLERGLVGLVYEVRCGA